jgi:hypothetical protein
MRDFDIINDILTNLDLETYTLTEMAALRYYNTNDDSMLKVACKRSGLTRKEILSLW